MAGGASYLRIKVVPRDYTLVLFGTGDFYCTGNSYTIKRSARTALRRKRIVSLKRPAAGGEELCRWSDPPQAKKNYVAGVTRYRRRILQAGFFCTYFSKKCHVSWKIVIARVSKNMALSNQVCQAFYYTKEVKCENKLDCIELWSRIWENKENVECCCQSAAGHQNMESDAFQKVLMIL